MPFCSKPLGAALSIAAIAAVTVAGPGRAQQDPPAAGQETSPQTATEAKPPQGPVPDAQTPAAASPSSQAPSVRADTPSPPSTRSPSRHLPLPAPGRPGSGKSAVVTAKVNLRSGPGTDSEIITTIPAGSAVRVADCSEWCAVTWNGNSGYVIARNLGPGAPRQAGAYPGQPGYPGPGAPRQAGVYPRQPGYPGPGAQRQAGPYQGQPGYEDYEVEPPVIYGAPGYYAPPAVVYGPAYYGPQVYGPGWGWRRRWGW